MECAVLAFLRKTCDGDANVFDGDLAGFGNGKDGRVVQFAAVDLAQPLGKHEHLANGVAIECVLFLPPGFQFLLAHP